MNKLLRLALAASLSTIVLGGCNSNPSKPTPPPSPVSSTDTPPPAPSGTGASGASGSAGTTSGATGVDGAAQDGSGPADGAQAGNSAGTATAGSSSAGANPGSGGTPEASNDSGESGTVSATAGSPAGSAQTDTERADGWDQEFDVSLGEFDKRIARERTEIEESQRQSGAGRDGSAESGEDSEVGLNDGVNMSGMPEELPVDESGETPTRVGSTAGYGQSGPRFPAPEGMPDGSDDDVVARQLREAAEQEKDPELRARLWEEYRKYKSDKS